MFRGFERVFRRFRKFFRGFQKSSQRPSQRQISLSEALILVALIVLPLELSPRGYKKKPAPLDEGWR